MTAGSARAYAFRSPVRYWQGPGEIGRLGQRLQHLGPNVAVLSSARSAAALGPRLAEGRGQLRLRSLIVESACTAEQIARVVAAIESHPTDLVLAVGGGTIIDTAKAAAHRTKRPVAVIPTLASTDAPTAAAAVIYTAHGAVESIETYPRGPEAILVDTDVIAAAPIRYLVSGFGDAMATFFEARACHMAGVEVLAGGVGTAAGLAIAEACRTSLLRSSTDALAYARTGRGNRQAFEAVVEANTLLSGVGFESGGLAAAHAIHNAIKPHAASGALHGELVAYGLLVQLALLDDKFGTREVLEFNRAVGLPTTARQLGLEIDRPEVMRGISQRACAPDDSMTNMPMRVEPGDVVRAIERVERIQGSP